MWLAQECIQTLGTSGFARSRYFTRVFDLILATSSMKLITFRSAIQRLRPTGSTRACSLVHHDDSITQLEQSSSNSLQSHAPTTLFMNHKCNLSTTPLRLKIFGAPDPAGPPPARKNFKESLLPPDWLKLIDKYPDFLPSPLQNNPLHVSLQVDDMLRRRNVIEIPEFYVGSVLAVTCSDQYSETKNTRFVGICIQRTGQLLLANFTLRNVIDGMGVEIRYDLYNPLIISIEVLRLEKRLDDELIYLRDAPQEYSTFPEDMKPEVLEEGSEVPINKLQVRLNPQPWSRRWEKRQLKGIEMLENVPELWVNRAKVIEDCNRNNFDTLMEYRRHCTEEQMYNICKRLAEHEKNVVEVRKEARARRFLRISKKPPLVDQTKVEQHQEDEISPTTEANATSTPPESSDKQ